MDNTYRDSPWKWQAPTGFFNAQRHLHDWMFCCGEIRNSFYKALTVCFLYPTKIQRTCFHFACVSLCSVLKEGCLEVQKSPESLEKGTRLDQFFIKFPYGQRRFSQKSGHLPVVLSAKAVPLSTVGYALIFRNVISGCTTQELKSSSSWRSRSGKYSRGEMGTQAQASRLLLVINILQQNS